MANHDSESQFIDIDDLRVGMYVFIDVSWIKQVKSKICCKFLRAGE